MSELGWPAAMLRRSQWYLQKGFWHRLRTAKTLKIIIPTINSARYIDLTLSYYRALNIPVTVFVDRKSVDRTASIAKRYAHDVVMVDNPATRVGEIIERISRHCGTRWVLRIDDDELPSLQMLAFVNSVIAGDSCRAVSFERHQCVVNRSGAMLRNTRHSPVVHRQWRLYQPDAVEFHARGHTRCFELDPLSELAAPSEAHMIHLDWVFHSREERVQKIARYDAHTPNHGTMFKDYYLGDTSPTFLDELTPLPAEEFVAVGRKMAARFPKSAVQADAPRPAARESA